MSAQPKHTLLVVLIMVLLFIGVFTAQYYQYTSLSEQQETLREYIDLQSTALQTLIEQSTNQLQKDLELQSMNEQEARLALEKQTLENIALVQESSNAQAAKLQQTLTLQAKNVNSQIKSLEEKNTQIEQTVNNIRVQSNDFTSIIDDVLEAVVSVRTNTGQGSGVIFTSDGLVMTNRHVIDGANSIVVIDANNKVYAARLLGTSSTADLAVLQIDSTKKFSALSFSDKTQVGQRVIAVGNPLGLSFSVTEGIVSALDRLVDSTKIGYIQTDVSINEGNSGGPLVTADKKVIGINTFKLSSTEGLGFAIPANVVKDLANQAIAAKKAQSE